MFDFSFLTRYFSKEDINYKDDYDGHFKYVKKIVPLPNFIRKLVGLPEVRPDRRKKRFGRIRANPFYYLTVPMFFTFSLVLYAAVSGFEVLVKYFNTNIYLNGLIISLMIFGILKTFYNSYMLYGTGIFIRKMEKVVAKEKIEQEDIYMLRRSLERQGELVNTIYMSQTIDNVEKFGHPNFNGMRSRLIKSKLGFRTGKNRSNVNFIAGILVMLGLLGTFLGLLGTIDAVGEAMNSMSSIGGESGEVGTEEMTGFIGSLAAPLQGMGLAFSSSLFGLSGSLLIGFFLHLAGTPQNEFIENVSRWIDDREIKFDPNVAKGSKAKVPPNDEDLKEWLSGFIHMSVRTNKTVSKLSDTVLQATNETTRAWSEVRGLSEAQHLLNNSTKEMGENIKAVRDHGQIVAQSMPGIVNSTQVFQEVIVDKMEGLRQDSVTLVEGITKGNQLMHHGITSNQKNGDSNKLLIEEIKELISHNAMSSKQDNDINRTVVKEIKELISQSNTTLNEILNFEREPDDQNELEILKQALFKLDSKQTEVLVEIKSLLHRLQRDPHMHQAQTLVTQLNDVLDKLNKKTKSLFSKKEK